MLWVGGSIIVHGLDSIGSHSVEAFINRGNSGRAKRHFYQAVRYCSSSRLDRALGCRSLPELETVSGIAQCKLEHFQQKSEWVRVRKTRKDKVVERSQPFFQNINPSKCLRSNERQLFYDPQLTGRWGRICCLSLFIQLADVTKLDSGA
ncbi:MULTISPECIES: hypothetical protein [Brucella]|uniref:hypothetical protein n=1 Tax=Brucella TaxID=234 RepID=UPI001FFC56DE|nr:hypothetical protein [Brucella intermedia]